MSGDYTKFSFKPRKRFSGVRMQQGRVQLDSDWNEENDIVRERLRLLSLDNFGPVGVPYLTTPDAFRLGLIPGPNPDLSIEPGRLYVDGLLAELFPEDNATYRSQPFLPEPLPLPAGNSLAYLDIWEREVTFIEDPELLDVALGGADTAARLQTVWQLRVAGADQAACGMPVGEDPSAGRLTTKAVAPPVPDDPCILPQITGYRGLENRLYRVEIHKGGPLNAARFKWSRDNGSLVAAVSDLSGTPTTLTVNRIGRDEVMRFRVDDWVTVTDDFRELNGEPGEMARIDNINEADRQIVLDRSLPAVGSRPFGANAAEIGNRHTRIQRWDQTPAAGSDGLVALTPGPIELEAGIQITFSLDPAGGEFRNGDYWVFWARTATAQIEELNAAPPRGIEHHYVQLGAISGLGGSAPGIEDCRPPQPGDGEGCCTFVVRPGDSIQEAINKLPDAGGCICLKAGLHTIEGPIVIARANVTLHGESMGAIVRRTEGGAMLVIGSAGNLSAREIRISSIVFQQGDGEEDGAIVALMRADSVVIDDCRLETETSEPGYGLIAMASTDLVITGCAFLGMAVGAMCGGGSRDVTISGCEFRLPTDRQIPLGMAIVAQAMTGPIVAEDNIVFTPSHGIVVDDSPSLNPASRATGSRVCGNRIRLTGRPGLPQRAFAIDVASAASIVSDNLIEHEGGNLAGIRLCGSGSSARGNVIKCSRGEQPVSTAPPIFEESIAIIAGFEEGGRFLPLERLVIADNIIEGGQHGILLVGVARCRVNGNILGGEGSSQVSGIAAQRATDCLMAENVLARLGFGFFLFAGMRNTISENRIEGGAAGIFVAGEEAPTVNGNRLTDLTQNAIVIGNAAQRCNVIENRVVRCGSRADVATGVSAVNIQGELHVEGNEVMDLGVPLDPRDPKASLAYGIAGNYIWEARIESNLVTYSRPDLRDVNGEDRALRLQGTLDAGPDVTVPGWPGLGAGFGYAIQIANNKFIGPGASALVELFEEQISDNTFLRFQRVLFHGNYCAHFTAPSQPEALTGSLSTAIGIRSRVTVKLVGRHCTITGNQVRATTPGVPSYRLIDIASDNEEMKGPFIGNVSVGHSGRSVNQMPVPESEFNTNA